jgi:hypothetical protein
MNIEGILSIDFAAAKIKIGSILNLKLKIDAFGEYPTVGIKSQVVSRRIIKWIKIGYSFRRRRSIRQLPFSDYPALRGI